MTGGPQLSEGNRICGKIEIVPMRFENMKFAQTGFRMNLLWLLCENIAGHCVQFSMVKTTLAEAAEEEMGLRHPQGR